MLNMSTSSSDFLAGFIARQLSCESSWKKVYAPQLICFLLRQQFLLLYEDYHNTSQVLWVFDSFTSELTDGEDIFIWSFWKRNEKETWKSCISCLQIIHLGIIIKFTDHLGVEELWNERKGVFKAGLQWEHRMQQSYLRETQVIYILPNNDDYTGLTSSIHSYIDKGRLCRVHLSDEQSSL